jgi:hypothetical protein
VNQGYLEAAGGASGYAITVAGIDKAREKRGIDDLGVS